tara:strand:- start:77 stop:763 length:687 start_codon:yes stop_codon:yes gene_type:complete
MKSLSKKLKLNFNFVVLIVIFLIILMLNFYRENFQQEQIIKDEIQFEDYLNEFKKNESNEENQKKYIRFSEFPNKDSIQCKAGEYINRIEGVCEKCPINSYSKIKNSIFCEKCNIDMGEFTDKDGSTKPYNIYTLKETNDENLKNEIIDNLRQKMEQFYLKEQELDDILHKLKTDNRDISNYNSAKVITNLKKNVNEISKNVNNQLQANYLQNKEIEDLNNKLKKYIN